MAEALSSEFNEMSLRQLECPICFEYCSPPIVQCINGHNVCSNCRPRIKICAICKGHMSDIRNLFAEEISRQMLLPCKFTDTGCTQKLGLTYLASHERICEFGATCMCKVPSNHNSRYYVPCSWRGVNEELPAHVAQSHPDNSFVSNIESHADLSSTHRVMKSHRMLVTIGNKMFWVLKSYDFRMFTLRGLVCMIGSEAQADKYEYHIQLCLRDELMLVKRGNVVSFDEFFCSEEGNYALGLLIDGKHMMDQFIRQNQIKFRIRIALKTNHISEFNWSRFNQASF